MLMQSVDKKKINFGEYTWWVLETEGSRGLVITETIIELRWYHEKFEDITWADCALRKYERNFWTHDWTCSGRTMLW
jgi:hypothetical protein